MVSGKHTLLFCILFRTCSALARRLTADSAAAAALKTASSVGGTCCMQCSTRRGHQPCSAITSQANACSSLCTAYRQTFEKDVKCIPWFKNVMILERVSIRSVVHLLVLQRCTFTLKFIAQKVNWRILSEWHRGIIKQPGAHVSNVSRGRSQG